MRKLRQTAASQDRSKTRDRESVAEIRKQAVEADFRVRNIKSGELTDDSKSPCDQDTPEDISLYILNNQDSGYDDTDQSQDNGDPDVVEGCLHTLGCVIAIYREKLQQSGAADHDIGIL